MRKFRVGHQIESFSGSETHNVGILTRRGNATVAVRTQMTVTRAPGTSALPPFTSSTFPLGSFDYPPCRTIEADIF